MSESRATSCSCALVLLVNGSMVFHHRSRLGRYALETASSASCEYLARFSNDGDFCTHDFVINLRPARSSDRNYNVDSRNYNVDCRIVGIIDYK